MRMRGGPCPDGGIGAQPFDSGTSICGALPACCAILSPQPKQACGAIVTGGNEDECFAALSVYVAAFGCPPPSNSCSVLAGCCPTLPANDTATCDIVASSVDASACFSAFLGYTNIGECCTGGRPHGSGSGSACGYPAQGTNECALCEGEWYCATGIGYGCVPMIQPAPPCPLVLGMGECPAYCITCTDGTAQPSECIDGNFESVGVSYRCD